MAVEFKHGDYIKASLDIVKANLAPAAVAGLLMNIGLAISLVLNVLAMVLPASIGGLLGLLGMLVSPIGLIQGLFVINWMRAVRQAKHEAKPITIGDLLNFENVVDKLLASIVAGLAFACCCIPGVVLLFTTPIMADRPGTSFMNAIKAALQFGKANLVPMLILTIVIGVVWMVGVIACVVGLFITGPIAAGALYLAYEEHKTAVEAAAAEGGVAL